MGVVNSKPIAMTNPENPSKLEWNVPESGSSYIAAYSFCELGQITIYETRHSCFAVAYPRTDIEDQFFDDLNLAIQAAQTTWEHIQRRKNEPIVAWSPDGPGIFISQPFSHWKIEVNSTGFFEVKNLWTIIPQENPPTFERFKEASEYCSKQEY